MRRRLTPIERVMWTLERTGPVAIALTARIRGRCPHAGLRAALDSVRRRHPMLAVRVTGIGPMNAWITTEDVPRLPLRIAGGRGDAVAEELREPFDATAGPLTRFVLVEHADCFDLAIVCHHLVGDGLSLAYVMRDIVARLADPTTRAGAVETVETVIEAPPMHDLVRSMPRPPASAPFKQPGSTWPVRRRTPGDEFARVDRVLEPQAGAALQARCRAERTSVHAALGVAGLLALAEADGRTRRQLYSPVNLRPLLTSLPEGACGNYAVELFTWFDVAGDTAFWPAARRLRATLRRQTAPDRLLRQVRLLGLSGALPNAVMSRLLSASCKPYPSLSFSNLGRLPFATGHGDLRIESMHGAVNMGTLSNGLLGAIAVDDRICLSISTTGSDRPAAEQMSKALVGQLRAALDAPG